MSGTTMPVTYRIGQLAEAIKNGSWQLPANQRRYKADTSVISGIFQDALTNTTYKNGKSFFSLKPVEDNTFYSLGTIIINNVNAIIDPIERRSYVSHSIALGPLTHPTPMTHGIVEGQHRTRYLVQGATGLDPNDFKVYINLETNIITTVPGKKKSLEGELDILLLSSIYHSDQSLTKKIMEYDEKNDKKYYSSISTIREKLHTNICVTVEDHQLITGIEVAERFDKINSTHRSVDTVELGINYIASISPSTKKKLIEWQESSKQTDNFQKTTKFFSKSRAFSSISDKDLGLKSYITYLTKQQATGSINNIKHHILNKTHEEMSASLDELKIAWNRAIDFALKHLGRAALSAISNPQFLIPLVIIFKEKNQELTNEENMMLIKWLFGFVLTQRSTLSNQSSLLQQDIKNSFEKNIVEMYKNTFSEEANLVNQNGIFFTKGRNFTSKDREYITILKSIYLHNKGIDDPFKGEGFNAAEIEFGYEFHHIQPQKLLKSGIVGLSYEEINHPANMILIRGSVNRQIGNENIGKYSKNFLKNTSPLEILVTDDEKCYELTNSSYKDFINKNTELIITELNAWVDDLFVKKYLQ